MPTTGVVDGEVLTLSTDGNIVACATSVTFTANNGTREIVCKDSDSFKDALSGLKDWSMSINGLFSYDAVNGGMDLVIALKDDPEMTLRWGSSVIGDQYIEGDGIISNVTLEGPNKGENATYQADFTGKGSYTVGTVT